MSELQRRADDLQSLAAVAENNPLRNQSFFATLPADIGALERQGAELAADLDRLPDAIETGRRAIVAARAQDEQFVRRSLTVEATEAGPLASYLYRQQVNDLLAELVSWLQWTRQAVPVGPRGPHATRGRGEEVVFDGGRRSPDLLLHHLTLAGTAQLGGQPIELQGTLTDFTTEPWLLSGPMRLRLKSTASLDLDVQLTMDRSGPVARDELLVTCRGLLLPPLVLGEADGVQLSVAQSVAELNFSLKLEGDRLTGEGQLVQSDVRIAAVVGEKLDHAPVAGQLQKTLEGVHSMATRLSLDGTISEPRCTVWSNIGPAAAAAMDLAISRAADERARQLMAQAQRQVDERLASLDRQMAEQQAGLIARLTTSAGELETLAVRSAPPQRLEIERLGRLPAQSLFR
jgi:uncharacterized protein (TIGR03545 family)